MDDHLPRLRRWAGRASMPRLYTELALRLAGDGFELEFEGEELMIFTHRKPAGLTGWLRRSERCLVLRLVRQKDQVTVASETADPAFVALLVQRLGV